MQRKKKTFLAFILKIQCLHCIMGCSLLKNVAQVLSSINLWLTGNIHAIHLLCFLDAVFKWGLVRVVCNTTFINVMYIASTVFYHHCVKPLGK